MKMSKYIDAEKIPYYIAGADDTDPNGKRIAFKADIDKIPAEDVRPERHGRCVTEYDGLPFCSKCGCNDYGGMLESMIYCPNCGAKMDGEEDTNEEDM